MFGALGRSLTESSVCFVSQAALENGIGGTLGLSKALLGVEGCRTVTKKSMVLNDATPKMEVDPETYEVRADGELLTCAAASELAMAQRYFLF
jgi:urease subunit alpha